VHGIDISEENIKFAMEKAKKDKYKKVNFYIMDFRELKFDDEIFDYVFSVGAICQITNKKDFIHSLNELLRVTKKEGRIILLENTICSENYISIPKEDWFKIIKECGGKIDYWCGIDIPFYEINCRFTFQDNLSIYYQEKLDD